MGGAFSNLPGPRQPAPTEAVGNERRAACGRAAIPGPSRRVARCRVGAAVVAVLLGACGAPPAPGPARVAAAPPVAQRIVSLDFCADQFVLKLADRDRILALSPDAAKSFSYLREAAAGLATVRPRAEDVLVLDPDLVVRSYGGGPNAAAFFEAAGVPVLQVGWAPDLEAVMAVVEEMAAGLGVPRRGAAVVAQMRARLAAVRPPADARRVLYVTPGGYTTGPGSLVHETLVAAGLENFEQQPGWRPLPLERLAYEQPETIAAAFFERFVTYPDAWSAARHPVARAQMQNGTVVPLAGAWTACGGWFVVDAVEALARGAGS